MRPDPGEPQEELRLLVALLPMHIRLDQLVCQFLGAFFAPPEMTVLVVAPGAGSSEDEAGGKATGVHGEEISSISPPQWGASAA